MFIDFREREGREKERNMNRLLSVHALTGDQTCGLGMCPNLESNIQPFGVWNDTPIN